MSVDTIEVRPGGYAEFLIRPGPDGVRIAHADGTIVLHTYGQEVRLSTRHCPNPAVHVPTVPLRDRIVWRWQDRTRWFR